MTADQMTVAVNEILQRLASITSSLDSTVTKVSELSVRMEKNMDTYRAEEKAKGERIGKLEVDLRGALVTQRHTDDAMDRRIANSEAEMLKIKADLEAMKLKGAKRWEEISFKVLMLLVSGAVLYFLARMGISV